ncbi:MAG: hypothetical protein IT343_04165 [Candidatus Melainabacteria bacterium]|jgi:hypothetical protein|nr:hypothetical protein [Candidatus Melainabacteria bacterium]
MQTCVIRLVRGVQEFIPAKDAVTIAPGETLFDGEFTTDIVKDGPSGSHERTVCYPVGTPRKRSFSGEVVRPAAGEITCVLREVKPGDWQYVPVSNDIPLEVGERLFIGRFNCHEENLGPYGSHRRMIALPAGPCRETVVLKAAA